MGSPFQGYNGLPQRTRITFQGTGTGTGKGKGKGKGKGRLSTRTWMKNGETPVTTRFDRMRPLLLEERPLRPHRLVV